MEDGADKNAVPCNGAGDNTPCTASLLYGWMVDLRRLESILLHGQVGDSPEMGRQVRHQHQGSALRLCAVAGRLRGEEHRRLRDDQYGSARHAGCRRGGYD